MKKNLSLLTLLTALLLVISACGQGNDVIKPSESSDSIDSDHNKELTDEETADEPTIPEEIEHPVYLYFSDLELNEIYSVEVKVTGEGEEVFRNTVEEWIKGPEHEELAPLIPNTVKVQSIEEIDGVAHISFSPELLEANVGSGADEMVTQQIALLMKQFGFKQTQILIDGEVKETLFGHVSTNEPIEAMDTDNIKNLN